MEDFDLSAAVAAWRRAVVARTAPEAEDLTELESGLLDRYDEYLLKGLPAAEAFVAARRRVSPEIEPDGPVAARSTGSSTSLALLANYWKVATRNLRTRRWYNLTNFVSLTLGILTVTLAFLYLRYETNYDTSYPGVEQKYRVGMELRSQGYSLVSFPDFNATSAADQRRQAAAFAATPGVRRAVQFVTFPGEQRVTTDERDLAVSDLLQTNTPGDFLDYFAWQTLRGNAAAFRTTPLTALLTEREAVRFFGPDWREREVIGRALRIDTTDYTIAGVLADVPADAHFSFSIALHQAQLAYWGARTYLELEPGASPAAVTAALNDNFGRINPRLGQDELFGGALLQPLPSLHLGSDLLYELKPPGDVRYLYIIGVIALIVLLLTVSNYTNLSVVMNAGRAREIGMRKVFGASAGQVAGQFVLEALLLGLFTLPVVLLALWYLLPRFNLLMGVALDREALWHPPFLALLAAIAVAVALLASIYPAFFLARTRVQGLFRGRVMRDSGGGFTTRKLIITLQFVLLVGLCSLTLFVNRQLDYIQAKDLGFDRKNILYVNLNADSARFATFRNEILRLPEVTGVGSGTPMGQQPYNQLTYRLEGTEEIFDDAHNVYLDYHALAQLGVRTSIPGYVARPETAPARLVLINATLANRLKNRFNLTDAELVGRTLVQEPEYVDAETGKVGFDYLIAGTFADIHLFSLRERVDPMFLTVYQSPRYVYWASISYGDADPAAVLAQVRERYEALGFADVFVHAFLDDNLAELYAEEGRIATLSNYFSLLAFLLAVIGLIALTAYLTTLKRKEIGIRKILGASHGDILRRFNVEYLWLLGLAMLVAIPLAWWGVERWLRGFAYRIEVTPSVFLVAGAITLAITTLAVSLVTLRAAHAIPARVLTRND